MAYSIKNYTGDGNTTDFLFDKPYINQSDVTATVDDIATAITWVDSTIVRFAAAPDNDANIILTRRTDVSIARFLFPDMTYLKSVNLDGNSEQQMFLHQEIEDQLVVGDFANSVLVDGSRSMTGTLILGDGTPDDNSPALEVRSTDTVGDASSVFFTTVTDFIGKIEAYDSTSASLNLFAYPNGAVTENSFNTQLSLKDGNASITGALGAATVPSLPNHLTNLKYVEDNAVLKNSFLAQTMGSDLNIYTALSTAILAIQPGTAGNANASQIRMQDSAGNIKGWLKTNDITGDFSISRYAPGFSLDTELLWSNDGNVSVNGSAPSAPAHLTRQDYVDGTTVALDGSRAMTGNLIVANTAPRVTLQHPSIGDMEFRFVYDFSTAATIDKFGSSNDFLLNNRASGGGAAGQIGLRGVDGSAFASVQGGAVDSLVRKDHVDSNFLKRDGTNSMTGELFINFNTSAPTYTTGHIELATDDGSDVSMGFHRGGASACQLRHEANGLILSGTTRTAAADLHVLGNVESDLSPTTDGHLTRRDYVTRRVAGGRISPTGVLIGDPQFTTVRVSIGLFRVTHNWNSTSYAPVASVNSSTGTAANITNIGLNTFDVETTNNAGALTDLNSTFIVTSW